MKTQLKFAHLDMHIYKTIQYKQIWLDISEPSQPDDTSDCFNSLLKDSKLGNDYISNDKSFHNLQLQRSSWTVLIIKICGQCYLYETVKWHTHQSSL